MAQNVLERVFQDIELLNPDELNRLKQAIDGRLSAGNYTPEEEKVHRALLAAGLLQEIKPRRAGACVERPLVPIQGQPLSETIIEERR